jgi:hypothetical protein
LKRKSNISFILSLRMKQSDFLWMALHDILCVEFLLQSAHMFKFRRQK